MKFYRHKETGKILPQSRIRNKDMDQYENIAGELSNQFNLDFIESTLTSIDNKLGWILAIIVIGIVLTAAGSLLATTV